MPRGDEKVTFFVDTRWGIPLAALVVVGGFVSAVLLAGAGRNKGTVVGESQVTGLDALLVGNSQLLPGGGGGGHTISPGARVEVLYADSSWIALLVQKKSVRAYPSAGLTISGSICFAIVAGARVYVAALDWGENVFGIEDKFFDLGKGRVFLISERGVRQVPVPNAKYLRTLHGAIFEKKRSRTDFWPFVQKLNRDFKDVESFLQVHSAAPGRPASNNRGVSGTPTTRESDDSR
jgi:hypothetical protein